MTEVQDFHPTVNYNDLVHHQWKVLLNNIHLNGHTLGFHQQTENLEPNCTAEQIAPQESTAQ